MEAGSRSTRRWWSSIQTMPTLVLLILCLWSPVSQTAFVQFSNCIDSSTLRSSPLLLQFVPLNVTAFFNTTSPSHNLNVTIYGNVTGQATTGSYPSPDDPSWSDPDSIFGKIPNLADGAPYYTTLFSTFNVLSYTPYTAPHAQFCNETINEACPVAPAFYVNRTELDRLPGWSVANDMDASYAFAEIIITSRVQSGYDNGGYYACVNAYITPDLGTSLRDLLRYLPLGILVVVGIATITAAIFSPWGTWDIFRWSSNFGRDEDVLRLVTPGFGDCLQYLQFIVLTGSLSLNYPGFYQPAVSRVGWSALLFNESFVTGGNGTNPIVDGIYQYRNASMTGLDRMTQLIGMTSPSDAWADMMVWLVIIIVAVVVLTQIGFALRWGYRHTMHIPAEDLRSKNWYFTVGNVIRVAIGFFILPLVSLSMYQFSISSQGPVYAIIIAAVAMIALIAFAARVVFLFIRTRPRSFLFDDLQTVLAWGPLYNTYCDDAATFALIPILVNFLRGIAIGAVQASGIAQVILLAISEVVFLLTINAFRPYPTATSMNLYHTCFSIVRLLTVLLAVAFVPSLNVSGASRGWIGYVILVIHACVLVFGFFLNAIQTLIEVIARRAGAGGSAGSGAARGGLVKVFGMRQLSKRMPRPDNVSRHSMASNAAMLNQMETETKDLHMSKTRSRSISASSQMLLSDAMRNPNRVSQGFNGTSDGQTTPDAASTFSKRLTQQSLPPGGIVGMPKQSEAKDPYYRPPRRNTMDLLQNPEQRNSLIGGEPSQANATASSFIDPAGSTAESSSTPVRIEDFDDASNELTKTKTDYAVREVDFYYGVRGPALSSGTRKLKTGPADPTGPVSNATGWFRGLIGGRKKEKTKGFEVVRSARAASGLMSTPEVELESGKEGQEPYHDSPAEGQGQDESSQQRRSYLISSGTHKKQADNMSVDSDTEPYPGERVASQPPLLPLIDTVGGIELPSRIGSQVSSKSRNKRPPPETDIPEVPALPRKSSRRRSSAENTKPNRLSVLGPSPLASNAQVIDDSYTGSSRLPFTDTQPSSSNGPTHRLSMGNESVISSVHDQDQENLPPASMVEAYNGHLRQGNTGYVHEERPGSVGYVREHRASDGITHQPAPAAIFEGKSAEIHGAHEKTTLRPKSNNDGRPTSQINPYGQPGQKPSRFRD